MDEIPRELLDSLTESLEALSDQTREIVVRAIDQISWGDITNAATALVEAFEEIMDAITDISASEAAVFYDSVRALQVSESATPYVATPMPARDPPASEAAVRAFVQSVVDTGTTDGLKTLCTQRADYELKRAAGRCVIENGKKDPAKPRFAFVPSGAETCNFCIMLGSRGFVYKDPPDHYHAHCKCRIVPGFTGETTVPGYDIESLKEQYKANQAAQTAN